MEKQRKPKGKIFIATPMYGGQCFGFYTQSILRLQSVLQQEGYDVVFSFMFNESLIQRARNGLTKAFLETDATHLFFIDADIRFQAEEVIPMLEADKEVICGIYPKKELNWHSVQEAMTNGVPQNEWKYHTGSFVVNLANYKGSVTVRADEPVEIWNGGTGFMIIQREVLEKLKPVTPTYTNDVLDLAGTMGADTIIEYFACSIEPESNRLLSEDYHFCRQCRVNGIKIWAAPWVNLAHVGTYVFEGRLIPTEQPCTE
jgi:hypothetical protein